MPSDDSGSDGDERPDRAGSDRSGGQSRDDQGRGQSGGRGQPGGQGQPREGQGQPGGRGQPGGQSQPGQPGGGQPQGGRGQPGGQGQPGGRGQPGGGGQPPGSAGGQPPGGAGYRQGRAPARGESVGDIFSKPTTQDQLKTAVAVYGTVGVAIGLAAVGMLSSFGGGGAASIIGAALIGIGSLASTMIVGAALGGPIGLHVAGALEEDEQDNLVYATAAVGSLAGYVVMAIIAVLFIIIGMPGGGSGGGGGGGGGAIPLGKVVLPLILGGIGAAVAAVGGAFAKLTFTGERPAPAPRQPAGQQPPNQQQQR